MFVDAPNVLQPADLVGFNLDSLGAGEANTENAEPDPRAWAFGFGRRICPGTHTRSVGILWTTSQLITIV